MKALPAALLVAATGVWPAAAGGVFLVRNPDGTLRMVNVPSPSMAFRMPAGGAQRSLLWPLVEEVARAHGLDPHLVDLVIRLESGYNPRAVSPKGAMGVMQLMPQTAALYGVANVFDAEENLRGGVRYLRDLLERFGFDLSKALAAYNAGPKAVEKHGGIPPYAETQKYVSSILSAYRGGEQAVLSGGFGRPTRKGPPVVLVQQGGQPLLTNLRPRGEAHLTRRLTLR
ncbi:MAG: lytic transglycosylase domain-containing protein [Thermoanaerobaculum sp.]|nr:lytic transglycosylase domain-containing protein [Thermoanaerobaculum sp.]MDW7968223.1 lytic transglycosylase domain-containing protein [Thermoanaerobaculum sp.]